MPDTAVFGDWGDSKFAGLLEAAPDAIVVVDATGTICLVNRQTETMFGYDRTELLGEPVEILMPRRAAAHHPTLREGYFAEPRVRPMGAGVELSARRKDGTEFPVDISLSPLTTEEGTLVSAAIRDATERKRAEAVVAHQALHDALTGLPNRVLLDDRLSQALERSRRAGTRVTVMFLDVDRLKVINDSRGHSAGDRLLKAIADRLRHSVRSGETIARFGGDEFVIISEGQADPHQPRLMGQRVIDAFAEPIEVEGTTVKVTVSVGVAVEDEAATRESLLRDADAAMYRAKEQGRDRVVIFDAALRLDATERLATETAMRSALQQSDFVVAYQPVVDLTDGSIVGVEALARWRHPERGVLEPDVFIPLAEETGLIVPLGEAVLRTACTEVAGWKKKHPGLASLSLAVNLSARQLMTPELRAAVSEILAASGLRPADLCLEITESVLLDDAESSQWALGELKSLGLRVAVDDFGTGYSSLTYLKRFPVDTLKIDRSFVNGLGGSDQQRGDRAIVAGVIDLAHAFGMTTVAEGVETADQLAELKALGCEHAQGFLWHAPMAAEEAVEWILDARAAVPPNPGPRSNGEPASVLLVEDDRALRGVLRYLLEEHGFQVVGEAADGREAIAMARHFQPDIVLLDLAMPGLGGLEALPLILAVDPGSKVIVMSALDPAEVSDRAMAAGAGGYFVKGADPELLLPYVDEVSAASPN